MAVKTIEIKNKKGIVRVDPEHIDETGQFGWCIVVVDRGFVWIGDVQVCGNIAYIANGHNIKEWGAPRGLGQLAADGPQSETKLDPIDVVAVPMRAVLAFVPAQFDAWKKAK